MCEKFAQGKPVSGKDIWIALNDLFPEKGISPRTDRHHLNKWEFPLIRDRLVKKTDHYYPLKPVEIKEIIRLARSPKESFRQVQRARMILQAIEGNSLEKVAGYWHLTVRTVRKWLNRLFAQGAKGQVDGPRSGGPARIRRVSG